jgi:hypothetical protein
MQLSIMGFQHWDHELNKPLLVNQPVSGIVTATANGQRQIKIFVWDVLFLVSVLSMTLCKRKQGLEHWA